MKAKFVMIDPTTDAVVNVDAQPTFMPGGGLPVDDGHSIIPVVQRVNLLFPAHRRYFTLDKHPRGHISLASSYVDLPPGSTLTAEAVMAWTAGDHKIAPHAGFSLSELQGYAALVTEQVLWPDHGIIGTAESELHPELAGLPCRTILLKGTDPCCDSYSGLRDNLGRSTGLGERLKADGARRLFLTGLAFDFCVGWTAIDAAKEGFEAFIIEDATRPVNMLPPGNCLGLTTTDMMRMDLKDHGVHVIHSENLIAP